MVSFFFQLFNTFLIFFFLIVWNITLSKLQDPPAAKNIAFTLLSACGKTLTHCILSLFLSTSQMEH